MIITESSVVEDKAQPDGRRRITQKYIDSQGVSYLRTFMAPADYDASTALSNDVVALVDTTPDTYTVNNEDGTTTNF